MKAIIIGATGATGRALVNQLLLDERCTAVEVFIRKPWEMTHDKLTTTVVDFEDAKAWQSKVVGDMAFSCLGTTIKQAGSKEQMTRIDYTYVANFAQACRENGVQTFALVSARGVTEKSLFFYSRLKARLEHFVLSMRFEKTVIVRPSLLLRPEDDRFGERMASKVLKVCNALGLFTGSRAVRVEEVAQALVANAFDCPEPLMIIENEAIGRKDVHSAV